MDFFEQERVMNGECSPEDITTEHEKEYFKEVLHHICICGNHDIIKLPNMINKQRVEEALKEIEMYIVNVQMSKADWKEWKNKRLGL